MTDKELQRLRRSELLEILLSQQKQIESLKKELAEAKEQLEDRKLVMARSGSIAEAALKLNGIFEAAQRAADQYLFSIGATGLSKKNGSLTGFDATGITDADQSCYTPNVPAQADPLSDVNESLQDDEGESNEPVTDDSVADDNAEDNDDVHEFLPFFAGGHRALDDVDDSKDERDDRGDGKNQGHRISDVAPEDLVPRVFGFFLQLIRSVMGQTSFGFFLA